MKFIPINKILTKVGEKCTIFLDPLTKNDNSQLEFYESLDGLNNGVIINRYYQYSLDYQNWSQEDLISYNWISRLPNAEKLWVRITYLIVKNLTGQPIIIENCQINDVSKPIFVNQGESVALSSIGNIINIAGMSEKTVKIETDINYYINCASPLEVNYWHTNPDKETTDVFLKEYSLHNVVSNKTIRVVEKDNKIPEPKHEFSQWGIEFEKLEIYIEKTYFEEIFGVDEKPRSFDYMYFPTINRMYYIENVYLGRGVNDDGNFYTCQIKKYENITAVAKDSDALKFLQDNLNLDDESFSEQQEIEEIDMTNGYQNLDKDILYDEVRKYTDNKLIIEHNQLFNWGNTISNYFYDFSKIEQGQYPVVYKPKISINDTDGISFMAWIKLDDTSLKTIYRLHDSNHELKINHEGNKIFIYNSQWDITEEVMIDIPLHQWVCLVISINNQHQYLSVCSYNIRETTTPDKTTTLKLIEKKERKFTKIKHALNPAGIDYRLKFIDAEVSLCAGTHKIRAIRISNKFVDQQFHSYIMSTDFVQKASHFWVIDDCKPNINVYKKGKSNIPILNKDTFNEI